MVDLRGRDFISIRDFTREELEYLIDLAIELKRRWYAGIREYPLIGKAIALLFKKHSTRTRSSFQVAATQLGADAYYMRPEELQLARGEILADTARVLDRYYDALVIRTFEQSEVVEYAKYMKKPVINALTNEEHPTQILADLMTIKEKKRRFEGLKLVYSGVIWNVMYSLMYACPKFGIDLVIAIPEGFKPNDEAWEYSVKLAKEYGTKIEIIHNLKKAVDGADIVYALTWYAMGQSEEDIRRQVKAYKEGGFTVTPEIMDLAKKDAIFMHCLPAHRGEEATDEVLDGPKSVIFDQAENKLHTAKAIYLALL